MLPRKTPQLAPWLPPDQGGLLPQPPAVDMDIAALRTRPTLPPPLVAPAARTPVQEPSTPPPPRPPVPRVVHTNDIASLPTEYWGDAPQQRRFIFTQYAEQHEHEAERLRQRLAELTELLPQRADALALKQSRLDVLRQERAHVALGGIEIQELAGLEHRLPEALARLQAERAEQARLPEQIVYHRHMARRWRKRAALER